MMMRSALKGSMSLSFNTASSSSLFPNWKPSEIRFSNRWGQRKVERSLSHSPDLLDHQCCRKRRDLHLPPLWEVVGGPAVVLWDLNTCPVPAGVDPRCVRPCIESAVEKEIGFRTAVTIYAMGNLESISIDLLQNISSSGIILTHAPCGVHDLSEFLVDWRKCPHPPHVIMVISGDYDMIYPPRYQGYNNFVAYPKGVPLAAPLDQLTVFAMEFARVFDKLFVWETLLSDNLASETLLLSDNNNTCDEEPLCICNICNDAFQVCDEFITHLKSDQHRNQSLKQAACIDRYGMPKHFCQVCNHPVYGDSNLLLHNQCEEHKRKLVEKHAQEEEDCESRKTNPELDLFYERNKKQSPKQEEAA